MVVNCCRYMTDHITQLPLGVMSRLLSAHDAVMALLPLVDSPPWVRDRPGGKVRYGLSTCAKQQRLLDERDAFNSATWCVRCMRIANASATAGCGGSFVTQREYVTICVCALPAA